MSRVSIMMDSVPASDFNKSLKKPDQLYVTEEQKRFLSDRRTSTGKIVHAVLVWPLKSEDATKKDKNYKRRQFFETFLTKDRVKLKLAENKQKLASGRISEAEREELMKAIEAQEAAVEFGTVEIEHEVSQDDFYGFTKIHMPFKTACHHAELAHLSLPLKKNPKDMSKNYDDGVHCIKVPDCVTNMMTAQDDMDDQDEFISGEFKWCNLDSFRNSEPENQHRFFSYAQMNMLLKMMLDATPFERMNEKNNGAARAGIDLLIKKGAYSHCITLHDKHNIESFSKVEDDGKSERVKLAKNWGSWHAWRKPQPLERIRHYFGEKIAFYFVFLGFYLRWLVVPAFVGLAVLLYGFGTYQDQNDAKEFCDLGYTMCAICSTCQKWNLSEACPAYRFSWVFDNGGTVFMAIFMAIWCTLFLEYWKRQTATTAYDWDVMNFDETEPQRPGFKGVGVRPHPVTGEVQRYFPAGARARRYFVSALVVFLMLSLVIWSVVGMIVFRLAVRTALYTKSESLQSSSGAITSALAAVLSLISIIILNMIYGNLAIRLTNYENHERQTNHEMSLAIKVFLFQFVNNFASIFYIAFFKGRFLGRPGDYNELFGLRQDDCPEYGCMLELTIQLAIIFVGKQAIGNMQEVVIPWIIDRQRSKAAEKRMEKEHLAKYVPTPWEDEMAMADYPVMGQFAEYLEMILQFGFVTLFVVAFPVAPWFAMLNNILEIRVDASKLVCSMRRPFASRAESIGIWQHVMTVMGLCAVVTNAFVIAITSNFIPKLVYQYRNGDLSGFAATSYPESPLTGSGNDADCHYRAFRDNNGNLTTLHYEIMMARLGFVIAFEHFVFFTKALLAYIVPDVPSSIQIAIERQEFVARQALEKALLGEKVQVDGEIAAETSADNSDGE